MHQLGGVARHIRDVKNTTILPNVELMLKRLKTVVLAFVTSALLKSVPKPRRL
jgi:hypothetical protein